MNYLFYLVPAAAVLALLFAWIFFRQMMRESEGTVTMKEIAQYVREGAMAYLKQQYKVVVIVFIVLAALFAVLAYGFGVQNPWVPFAFLTGGFFSGLAGFVFLMHKPAGNASVALRSEMDAIASSIIGGTLLTGGVGNVIGSFFGTMILGTIQKIIALSPLNASWWQEMANGAMLGLFIMLQSVILMRRHNKKH